MDKEELQAEVSKIQWFHSIELPHGIVTPGVDNSEERLARLGMPETLRGKSVLDIGAWDGFFSFEAERRGASSVLATDSYSWSGEGWGSKAGFEIARRALASRVDDREVDVFDLSPHTVGTFDLVLFLGVLYHLRHPLLALEHVASVSKDMLILDSQLDLTGLQRPVMAFYPGTELANDPTNWWAPNPRGIVALLEAVGFRKIKAQAVFPTLPGRILRAAKHKLRNGDPFFPILMQARGIFHAWK